MNEPVLQAPRSAAERDRRKSKRFMTWRNGGRVLLALFVVFVIVSLYGEFRPRKKSDFGRLYEKRKVENEPAPSPKRVEVIPEASISDETSSDPLLVQSATRERYLGVEPATVTMTTATSTADAGTISETQPTVIVPPPGKPILGRGNKGRIRISGGAEGVQLEVQKP